MNSIKNILFLSGTFLFSLYYYFQVMEQSTKFEHHAVISSIIFILSFLILIQLFFEIRKMRRQKNLKQDLAKWKKSIFDSKILIFISFLTLYLFAVSWIGYFSASLLFFILIIYWLGSRKWKELFLIPTIVLICIYLIFVVFLNQKIIQGLLI